MTYGTRDLNVAADGSGEIKFRASAGDYDENGLAKKTWTGTITYPKAGGGDTTYTVTEEYFVVKPVVKVQSDVSTTLYKNCGNALDIQVPALGAEYNPSFNGTGCNIIPGRRGKLIVVPKRTQITIGVSSGGMRIDNLKYKTKKLPPPNVNLMARGRNVDPIRGISISGVRGLKLKLEADPDIKVLLPRDTKYRVKEGTITVARGSRGIATVTFTSANLDQKLRSIAGRLSGGERLIFDLKRVERKTFENVWVEAKPRDPIVKVFVSGG
jgi:gliding motility-associated protein GldM